MKGLGLHLKKKKVLDIVAVPDVMEKDFTQAPMIKELIRYVNWKGYSDIIIIFF